MTIDIKAIRAAAEAAPQDSWRYESYGQTVWANDTYMVADIRGWGYLQQRPNGAEIQDATGVHIATANPATVIALCDEIERLRFANRDLSDWFEAAKIDAVRYNWFRQGNRLTVKCKGATVMFGPNTERDYPEQLDAAIDAAMESK